jgi:hypothetical protein
MADDASLPGNPDDLAPDPQPRTVSVTFDGEWLKRIDALKENLVGDKSDVQAVGTAVATLSKYAGQPLYVKIDGEFRILDPLWKSA